jgi:hypothetical protein
MSLNLSDRREYLRRLRKLARVLTGRELDAAARAILGELTLKRMETR